MALLVMQRTPPPARRQLPLLIRVCSAQGPPVLEHARVRPSVLEDIQAKLSN